MDRRTLENLFYGVSVIIALFIGTLLGHFIA